MGSILINVPDIPDSDLIFNDTETRQILKFFWPGLVHQIDALTIDNPARRLAQTALIAAIDGSYAMGYIEILFKGLSRPSKSLSALAKKLARDFARHRFNHATQKDLNHVRIYETIRSDISNALKTRLRMLINGIALHRAPLSLALLPHTPPFASC